MRIKRTLDGAEIDKIISDVEAQKALAVEHPRRADWRERQLVANTFCKIAPADDAQFPQDADDLVT